MFPTSCLNFIKDYFEKVKKNSQKLNEEMYL